jgi:cobalt-zinc-cadmium efflux system protein
MEFTPRGVDVDAVRDALAAVPGVLSVHDLHVWTITSGLDSLSAHVVVADATADGPGHRALLTDIRAAVHQRFGIDHVTIQVEPRDFEERHTVV